MVIEKITDNFLIPNEFQDTRCESESVTSFKLPVVVTQKDTSIDSGFAVITESICVLLFFL